jgi:hypothetical protein
MPNAPRQPKTNPASKSGLKEGEGAGAPQSDVFERGAKRRPVEEEDIFGGAERTHDARVTSNKAKP